MTKLQFQHQTSGHDSYQPVEFASAGAERQSHKVNVKHDNIWAVLWPGRVLVSLCWGRAGLSLHHTEVYQPRSITFTAHGDRMEYFQTEYNILPPGAAPPRKADLPHHQNQADGWQTRVVCSRIKLNSSAQQKKPNSAAKGLRRNNLCPTSFIRASFPPPDEGFRGERRRRKCLSFLGAVLGRGRGRNERVWGREDKPIPSNPIARGSGAGPCAAAGELERFPFPTPAYPTPSHPIPPTSREAKGPTPPRSPRPKGVEGGTDGAAPLLEASGAVGRKE